MLCLAGALLVLLSSVRAWAEVVVPGDALRADRVLAVDGSVVAPGVRALGLVALAGVVAVLASRGAGRVVTGLLLTLVGAGVVAESLRARSALEVRVAETTAGSGQSGEVLGSAWPWVAVAGGLVVLLAGLLVAVRGRRWSAMSARYEPPSSAAPVVTGSPGIEEPGGAALWSALDRGEDPFERGAEDR